jgi:hypothetical protein
MKDPQKVAAKWSGNLSASTETIKDGIMAVTRAPGQAAAAAKDLYLMRVQARVGAFAANSARVTLAEWQSAAVTKGVPRIATGAQAAQDKFAAFIGPFMSHIDAGVRALPARGNLEQNIARMVSMTRHNATFKRPA